MLNKSYDLNHADTNFWRAASAPVGGDFSVGVCPRRMGAAFTIEASDEDFLEGVSANCFYALIQEREWKYAVFSRTV